MKGQITLQARSLPQRRCSHVKWASCPFRMPRMPVTFVDEREASTAQPFYREVAAFRLRNSLTSGASEAQAYRIKLEFHSRLCGKIIQHLEKQVRIPDACQGDNARWSCSGLYFVLLHNFNNIHQKDLVVILVAIVKILRGGHHGQYALGALQECAQAFLTCLFTCNDRVLQRVHKIADGSDPIMNKWRSFAELLRQLSEQTQGHALDAQDVSKTSGIGDTGMSCSDDTSCYEKYIGVEEIIEEKRSPARDSGAFACTGCLARDASETLFAKIVGKCTLQKDFARVAFVLYWLSKVGFSSEITTRFFEMNLRRMLALQSDNRSEPCPRDFISVLRYSLHFDIDGSLREALYGYLAASNKKSLLHLTLQDTNNLVDCLLEKEQADQGLLVAVFANVQLSIKAMSSLGGKQPIGVAHSYLAERRRLVEDARAHWDNIFVDFEQLKDLVSAFVGRDSLCNFLQKHCLPPSELRVKSGFDADAVNRHAVFDIVRKLQKLCPAMEETQEYCVKLIESALRSLDNSQHANR
ncbi:hypothetical protein, conserved [Babesia bigemina]|uniref:Uncharacterized protein n=1 Tax=Babesia bigemina TaxID=5866 RepID=A0A061CYM3_BABBI|nr:hypothetical protein, conserved [Babesia bigemina]CDR93736.1 hypothetical protein, conserved [Babesia bigemina]|eukprot:XP_012765922.1 hypothetical protein, conserved [Babesia bigemina]